MKIKVLFTGDEGIYIAKKGNYYYTVDILEDIKPMKSKYVESFLKFGGFEFVEQVVSEEILNKIKAVLDKYDDK